MAINGFIMGSNQTYTGETFINPQTMAAGSNNTFIDCRFEQYDTDNNWSCFVLSAKNNVSTVGNKFINCTFTGGLEEGAGADVGGSAPLWSVTSISGSSVTLAMLVDVFNMRNVYAVGSHLIVQRGDSVGNYYEIVAKNGNTFTLASDKFDVSEISVGDHVTTTAACVDNEWIDCTVYTSKSKVLRNVTWRDGKKWIWGGYGAPQGFANMGQTTIVSGFSNYGSALGSVFKRCHVIGDGWTMVGDGTDKGVETTQTGIWIRGSSHIIDEDSVVNLTPQPLVPNPPHHVIVEGCTVTGCDQAFNGGSFQYGLHHDDYVFPPTGIMDTIFTHQVADYPASHITVKDCNFGGGQFDNWFGNVVKSQWINTTHEPISTFDVSLQRFGMVWANEYPLPAWGENGVVNDPFPTKSVNLGDASMADYTIEYMEEPKPQVYLGDILLTVSEGSFEETDPTVPIHNESSSAHIDIRNELDSKQPVGEYLTSETDPLFTAWDKDYNDLTNKPVIPSDISDLTDGSNMFTKKADLIDGKVPESQLPSYVDDVLEFVDFAAFPSIGEAGKIYVAIDVNKTYRWSGSGYVEIGGGGVALGETSATAYRGDRGKIAYDHSQSTHAPTDAEKNVNADWLSMSGDSQILNKPSIPTKVSDLTNDSGFLASETDPVFTAWDKDYEDLTNKPVIPSIIGLTQAEYDALPIKVANTLYVIVG